MIEASEYIKGLVSSIDNSLVGTYDSASGKTLVCNTKWARVGKIITDSLDRKFKITQIGYDKFIIADPVSSFLHYRH